MPLVVDQLQLWTIGFKWAGLDPHRPWLRIPTLVRDNFSTLLEAILSDHLGCLSLASEKYAGDDPEVAKFYIRDWLDDVYAGIHGQYFNRKLLKHAVIDRGDFQDWCERRTIPLPEFWFPPGWTEYRWPSEDFEPIPQDTTTPTEEPKPEASSAEEGAEKPISEPLSPSEVDESKPPKLRPVQLAKIVSQQIARVIWSETLEPNIPTMANHELILKYGGGRFYSPETVERWVREAAPPEVSARVGRPSKKKDTEDK